MNRLSLCERHAAAARCDSISQREMRTILLFAIPVLGVWTAIETSLTLPVQCAQCARTGF
jgi:hypothetical protein